MPFESTLRKTKKSWPTSSSWSTASSGVIGLTVNCFVFVIATAVSSSSTGSASAGGGAWRRGATRRFSR
jgi:hypothetical protein